MFHCDECDKKYVRKEGLDRHQRQKHGKEYKIKTIIDDQNFIPIYTNVLKLKDNKDPLYEKLIIANKKYKINKKGIIISYNKTIIKPRIVGKYIQIILNLGKSRKDRTNLTTKLHRVLYLTFSNNIPQNYFKLHIDHIDETLINGIFNNNLKNLRIVEPSINSSKSNKKGNKNNMNGVKIKIIGINSITGETKEFQSQNEAARKLEVKQGHISENIYQKRNNVKGWIFTILDDLNYKENEIFKKIPNSNKYISNYGRTKHLKTDNILNPKLRDDGYISIDYQLLDGIRKKELIHRLVCKLYRYKDIETFNSKNKSKSFVVNHKDCIRHHNCVNNLEIVTYSENNLKNNKNINILSLSQFCSYCNFKRY